MQVQLRLYPDINLNLVLNQITMCLVSLRDKVYARKGASTLRTVKGTHTNLRI